MLAGSVKYVRIISDVECIYSGKQISILNIYGAESNNWGFVARPEIGLLAKFNYDIAGLLGEAYNYSTNKNNAFNISHLSQIPITIGVVFSPR